MTTDFKTPVKCPNCHNKLTIVELQVTKVLEWTVNEDSSKNEGIFEDNGQGATEVFCYNCHTKIGHYDVNKEWGLFPDDSIVNI